MKGFIRGILAAILGMILAKMGFMFYDSWEFWAIFLIYGVGVSL